MNSFKKPKLLAFILAVSLMLTGCALSPPISQEGKLSLPSATEPSSIVTKHAAVVTENPDPYVDPTTVCPTPSNGRLLYLNPGAGFCFLYPESFSAQIDPNQPGEIVQLLGPQQELGPKTQESLRTFLNVSLNGPSDGMDSQQYASMWLSLYAPEIELQGESATIGGQPAEILSGLPGFTPQRGAFIVTPDGRYSIFLSPQPEDVPELAEQASLVWETVTESLVFFKPPVDLAAKYKRAEDACPQASTEMELLTDYALGYCLLFPADFDIDPTIPGRLVGGPVLDNREGFGQIRTSLAVGTLGYFPGQSPLVTLHSRMDSVDPDTLVETRIAGLPAVIFRGPREPWTHRQAFISVDGMIYTIVAQPEEPERYAQGMPYLERAWNLMLDSLAFFTPWR
ncbi:MAG: hypothetical protein ACNA8H_12585 [Anaerolineales bacterium]